MRLLRPLETDSSIRWINRHLAVGRPDSEVGWGGLRARGVRAVVDVDRECGEVSDLIRRQGMRYLRLPADRYGLPQAEELHIVTSWVLERIRETGSVLLHDRYERGNDALLACAVLVKSGGNAQKVEAQVRGVTGITLTVPQRELLHQFMAQRAMALKSS